MNGTLETTTNLALNKNVMMQNGTVGYDSKASSVDDAETFREFTPAPIPGDQILIQQAIIDGVLRSVVTRGRYRSSCRVKLLRAAPLSVGNALVVSYAEFS